MAYATEKWSARTWTPGVSASQAWIVTGVNSMSEALNAPGVSIAGSSFVLDNSIFADKPRISTPDSPQTYIVEVNFAAPGGGLGGATISDLSKPPEYWPQIASSNEPVDRDVSGNAIVNSAGDPFSNPYTKRYRSIRYIYSRYEATFDGQRAIAYSGAVNSDAFFMPGFGVVQGGQALCESITVASAFTKNTTAKKVVYTFELRGDGFKARILDVGTRAYYRNSAGTITLGYVFTQNGNPMAAPVRLNGVGNVMDTTLRVGTASSTGSDFAVPKGAEIDRGTSGTFLLYKIYNELPFSGLTLTE